MLPAMRRVVWWIKEIVVACVIVPALLAMYLLCALVALTGMLWLALSRSGRDDVPDWPP